MTAEFRQSDLTAEEVASVLATITGIPREQVEDFLIIIKQPCNCGRQYCAVAPIASTGSRHRMSPDGTAHRQPAFELHLAAAFIDTLAGEWQGSQDE